MTSRRTRPRRTGEDSGSGTIWVVVVIAVVASFAIGAAAIGGAVFAFALSLAQRDLSTQVRDVRRRVTRVEGTVERADGTSEELTADRLMGPAERALRILSVAVVALACALVMMRVW